MQAVLSGCSEYPDDDASALRLKLAERHSVPVEQVLVTGGLTEFLGMVARAFLAPGLNAVTSHRSFIVYRMATEAAGAQLIEVPLRRNGFDLDGIAAAANSKTRIIFLANPNNPTGSLVEADQVDHLLSRVPDPVLVLDEAYYEYAEHFAGRRGVKYSHSLDYVREGRNVMVLRTFSKVHGLAGARVGYGIASAELIARIARQRSMYCVSRWPRQGRWRRLRIQPTSARPSKTTRISRRNCFGQCLRWGYTVTSTWGNFVYCEIGRDARGFAEHLRLEGILVRPLDQWGAPESIRISIGTPEQNAACLRAIKKLKSF